MEPLGTGTGWQGGTVRRAEAFHLKPSMPLGFRTKDMCSVSKKQITDGYLNTQIESCNNLSVKK